MGMTLVKSVSKMLRDVADRLDAGTSEIGED